MCVLLFACTTAMSQQAKFKPKTWIGVNPTIDLYGGKSNIGVGISFEQQLSKHLGYEVGGYFRSRSFIGSSHFSPNTTLYMETQRQPYISIPLMFKFYSRILNFNVGVNVETYIGKDEMKMVTPTTLGPIHQLDGGVILKISKSLRICNGFQFEPELSYNPMFSDLATPYVSLGLKFKFGGSTGRSRK